MTEPQLLNVVVVTGAKELAWQIGDHEYETVVLGETYDPVGYGHTQPKFSQSEAMRVIAGINGYLDRINAPEDMAATTEAPDAAKEQYASPKATRVTRTMLEG